MEKELLSAQELEMVKGAFGFDVRTYGLNLQGVNNCCNTTTQPTQPGNPGQPSKELQG